MNEFIIFLLCSAFFVWISWLSILNPLSHGFYRFLAWEIILALVLLNIPMWAKNPFSINQIASWFLLVISILLALHAFYLLYTIGKPNAIRNDPELLALEKTSILVTIGVYRYIRHPVYTALLLLVWGVFLKEISIPNTVLALTASAALYYTALREEEECIRYFGLEYVEYIKTSKRFVPFLL
jgi:protein-S-isoprenylcysteine O-methyltransferase Ste14